jgi:hypothetical protein
LISPQLNGIPDPNARLKFASTGVKQRELTTRRPFIKGVGEQHFMALVAMGRPHSQWHCHDDRIAGAILGKN